MSGKCILILEDEPASLQFLLRIAGESCPLWCDVYGYDNLESAFRCMEQHEILLFIVDIRLTEDEHDRSGYEFVEKLRKSSKYRFTPVIFVTGLEEPRADAYKELHCMGYLQKPFDMEQISRMITMCLEFPKQDKPKKICIRQEGVYLFVEQEQIVYLRTSRKQLQILFRNGELQTYDYVPLRDILAQITSEKMILCGKGIAVNRKWIDHVRVRERELYLKGIEKPVPVGIHYMSHLTHSLTVSHT